MRHFNHLYRNIVDSLGLNPTLEVIPKVSLNNSMACYVSYHLEAMHVTLTCWSLSIYC